MTTNTMTIQCITCSGTGIDPGFGDACVTCSGSGRKMTAVSVKESRPTGPTEKQSAFFEKIVTELLDLTADLTSEADVAKRDAVDQLRQKFPTFTTKQASSTIDFVLDVLKNERHNARQVAATARAATLSPGLYVADGHVVKVQASKSSGNLYALLLNETTGKYEYAPGGMRFVKAENRLTLEEAEAVSKRIGRCCVCSRVLTNKDSVQAGIGPICAGKL